MTALERATRSLRRASNTAAAGLLAALAAAAARAAEPPPTTAEANAPAVLVQMRLVQRAPDANVPAASQPADARASVPRWVTDPNSQRVFGVAPRGQAVLLGGQVLPAATPKARSESAAPAASQPAGASKADLCPGSGPAEAWRELSAPRILCRVGQSAAVTIGAGGVPYMIQRPDGSFVLEHAEPEGLNVEVRIGAATSADVLIEKLELRFTQVVGREPLDGVPLDVGRPRYNTRQMSAALRLAPDQTVVIPVGAEDLYLLVTAELAPGDGAAKR